MKDSKYLIIFLKLLKFEVFRYQGRSKYFHYLKKFLGICYILVPWMKVLWLFFKFFYMQLDSNFVILSWVRCQCTLCYLDSCWELIDTVTTAIIWYSAKILNIRQRYACFNSQYSWCTRKYFSSGVTRPGAWRGAKMIFLVAHYMIR